MTPSLRTSVLATAVAALTLSGCATTGADDDVLTGLGLEGRSGKEIVEHLDASPEPRPLSLAASVREDAVLISDGEAEVAVALPGDQQYVSVAPYVEHTHKCYYHSLATCQGELAEVEVEVRITGDDGRVIVDEVTETHANGFVGFWVPEDISGTIEVWAGDLTGRVPFTTAEGSATCITTLQLG